MESLDAARLFSGKWSGIASETSSRPYGTFHPSELLPRTGSWAKFSQTCPIGFERCLGSATTLSLQRPSPFCHPERSERICGAPFLCPAPGPTTATNLNTKSVGVKPRDLRYRGPLLETPNEQTKSVVPHLRCSTRVPMDPALPGWADFGAGPLGLDGKHRFPMVHSSLNLTQASRLLGMTKRRGSFQGKGGC